MQVLLYKIAKLRAFYETVDTHTLVVIIESVMSNTGNAAQVSSSRNPCVSA